MIFEFEVPDEMVALLELTAEQTAEEIMEKHLYEWWFSKTHHEADLIVKGKHKKVESPTQAQRDNAEKVRRIVYHDAIPYSDEELGIKAKDEADAKKAHKEAKAKGRPLPPFPNGQLGDLRAVIKSDKFKALRAAAPEEDKALSDEQFLKKKIAEMEKSEQWAKYKADLEAYQAGMTAPDNLSKTRRMKHHELAQANKYRPNIRRKSD